MSLFKIFGKTLPLTLTALLLFCAPALAEEKTILSQGDSYYVLAHKMVDYGAGIGGYYACKNINFNDSTKDTENIIEWLQVYAQKTTWKKSSTVLFKLFWGVFETQAINSINFAAAGDAAKQKELCEVLVPLYEQLEMPK